jgi:hypothetical protein
VTGETVFTDHRSPTTDHQPPTTNHRPRHRSPSHLLRLLVRQPPLRRADPTAVVEGSPADKSRKYSIAAQQIVQLDVVVNEPNLQKMYGMSVNSVDPSRPQDGSADPSIEYGVVSGVSCCASYNAELYKQLSPTMVAALKKSFPAG